MNEPLTMSKALQLGAERRERTPEVARQYVYFTESTAKYPSCLPFNVNPQLVYVAIGLAGEIGELAEIFCKETQEQFDRKAAYKATWKELGDVQWYAARMPIEFSDSRFKLMPYHEMVRVALELRETTGNTEHVNGFDLQAGLAATAGRILGVVKKMIRDGNQWTDEQAGKKAFELQEYLQNLVYHSVLFAENTGPSIGYPGGFESLLSANTEKLTDRKDRGVLHGDGDNR